MRGTAARSGTTAGRAVRAWPAMRRAGSIAASRCWAIACSWSPTTLICSRCTGLTGQLLWDVEMADSRQNYGVHRRAPGGQRSGDRRRFRRRRRRSRIPGRLQGFHRRTRLALLDDSRAPANPGPRRGAGRAIEHGCGATWLTGTYDPEAQLLYWPTGNPCPDYNGDERKGDNLYTASVLALDPATGKLKWHYQFTPHDLHDWDATETPVLVDATFPRPAAQAAAAGQSQRILLRARPAHRQGPGGGAVRQEADLGQRHRAGRAAHPAAGK